MFLRIEELTWNEAMNVTRVFCWNPRRVMFHLGSHFVSRDFSYSLPFELDTHDE